MPEEAVATPAAETPPPAAAVEEVKPPTIAETEAAYKANWDKQHGRDISKFKAEPVKAEVKPVEVKPDAKAEVVKAEAKADDKPATPPVKKSGSGRLQVKLAVEREKSRQLETRLAALEASLKAPAKESVAPAAAVEPTREQFQTDAEYFAAVRKFDKEQLAVETKKVSDQRVAEDAEKAWRATVEDFNTRLAVSKAKYADWDEKTSGTNVKFNPILQGVLMAADTDLLYEFASAPRDARNLNEMSENSVVAAGNADDVTGVLRWLSAHPDDIDKLNSLAAVKAQTFVGKIEAKIEQAKAAAGTKEPVKAEAKKEVPPSGEPAKQSVQAAGAPAGKELAPKAKPEPPPKLNGVAPSHATWSDPQEMSLAERERLMREDPRYARRR